MTSELPVFVPRAWLDEVGGLSDETDRRVPWPRSLVLVDLRAHVTFGVPLTARRAACRWHWSKDRAHRLMRHERDKLATPDLGPNTGINAPRDTSATAARHASRVDHASAHAPISLPPQDLDPEDCSSNNRSSFDSASKRVSEVCSSLGLPAYRLTPRSKLGRALNARLDEHGPEAVDAVLEWWQNSKHGRARFLRQQGIGLATVLKPDKFAAYLAMATSGSGGSPRPGQWIEPDRPLADEVDDIDIPEAF